MFLQNKYRIRGEQALVAGQPDIVAVRGAPLVLMHMRGTPSDMHRHATYGEVAADVRVSMYSTWVDQITLGGGPEFRINSVASRSVFGTSRSALP